MQTWVLLAFGQSKRFINFVSSGSHRRPPAGSPHAGISGPRAFYAFVKAMLNFNLDVTTLGITNVKALGVVTLNLDAAIRFLEQLITAQQLPREEITRNSLNDEFDLFEKYSIPFPKEVECANDLKPSMFEGVGIADHREYFTNMERRIMTPLRQIYPQVRFCFGFSRKAGLGYFSHLCFHIFADNQKGDTIQLSDGGVMDWAAKLLNNRKEVTVASVIGGELLQRLF